MKTTKRYMLAAVLAVLAACFYALNVPVSKTLLCNVPSVFMASFLYLGAGIGVGVLYLFHIGKESASERLNKRDFPYTIGMVVLDIFAPIFLMLGIKIGSASNASLLGNFEIVATAIIALLIFRETISKKLWTALLFITASSIVLSFDGADSFHFSYGSLFVILATVCWGFENNCTRKISQKSTYEIVLIKGVFSGMGSFIIALLTGEHLPAVPYILLSMLLGFISYGLSIFLYIRAQRELGAAKTSAYYAVAPFIGSFLSVVMLGDRPGLSFLLALALMMIGTVFVVADTLSCKEKTASP